MPLHHQSMLSHSCLGLLAVLLLSPTPSFSQQQAAVPPNALNAPTSDKACFTQNGDYFASDKPCNALASSSKPSFCCNSSQRCLAGGMCETIDPARFPGPTLWRATCTDRTWGSRACPNFCRNTPSPALGPPMKSCGNDLYCCLAEPPTDRDCCGRQESLFRVLENRPYAAENSSNLPSPVELLTVNDDTSPSTSSDLSSVSETQSPPAPTSSAGSRITLPLTLALLIPFALILILITYLFVLHHRRRQARLNADSSSSSPKLASGRKNLDGGWVTTRVNELGGSEVPEMADEGQGRYELPGGKAAWELGESGKRAALPEYHEMAAGERKYADYYGGGGTKEKKGFFAFAVGMKWDLGHSTDKSTEDGNANHREGGCDEEKEKKGLSKLWG
ncbi:MAG: hypothetical protein M1817_000980 [Caeruleum heppii]|nr:MAG: hypothetical protein M1817_000980 [Caeruleum heppii]